MVLDPDWRIPSHEVEVFFSRKTRYAVLIPVLNEGARIRKQLERMRPYLQLADTLIVDGNSSDGSNDPAWLRSTGVRALLVKTGPGRLSAQLRVGLAWAMEEGYSGVVLIDGNDKDDPGAIPAFLAALDDGCDHAQGSRFLPGGRHERTPWSRLLGIRLVHAPLISLAAGRRYSDTTNGFRAYGRKLLLDPRVQPFREVFSDYELHYYLAIRAARLGFDIRELPVGRSYPAGGFVPTKISGLRGNARLFGTLLRACLHRYDPPAEPR